MWHLQLVATSFQSIPFEVPTFAGATLSGYNILMDIVIYALSLVGVNPLITFFKIIPLFWFVSLTLTGISFAQTFNKSLRFVFITLFLIYFAGHFGYILQLIQEGSIFRGSQSFSMQSMNALLNPQFALTLPIILAQLIILKKQKFSARSTLHMSFLTFFSLGLKFYGGVVSVMIAGWYLLDFLILKKNIKKTIIFSLVTALIAGASIIIFYNPFAASSSGSVFIFAPFSIVHSMIEALNMFYLPNMVDARYYLYEQGWSMRLLGIELFSTILYIFVNFGIRLLGIGYVCIQILRRRASRVEIYILGTVILSFTLSVLFIQRGGWWNTIQFGYYSIFLSSILTAIATYQISKKLGKWGVVFIFIVLLLSIPSSIRAVIEFVTPHTFMISHREMEAMEYLKTLPDGVVFTSFQARDESQMDYINTGYVAAFTGKSLYLAQLGQLELIGIDASERIALVESNDCRVFDAVEYIYYKKDQDETLWYTCNNPMNEIFKKVFENEEVIIFQRT